MIFSQTNVTIHPHYPEKTFPISDYKRNHINIQKVASWAWYESTENQIVFSYSQAIEITEEPAQPLQPNMPQWLSSQFV